MNRWKKAAVVCAIIVAVSNSLPLMAALNRGGAVAQASAIAIKKHFPSDMAMGVALDSPLTVEFAGTIDQSFYQTVNFNLFSGTDHIEGELFYNPSARQVMFKSKQALNQGRTYTAQLSYFDGLGRNAEKVWSFRTNDSNSKASSPSPIGGISNEKQSANNLVLTNANMGTGSVRSNMPLEVTFSEPIDITSLKTAPVQLFGDNRPIGVDYKLSRNMKTITINPRESMKNGVAYAIAVARTLTSTSGSRLRQKTLIPFNLSDGSDGIMVENHVIEERPAPASQQVASPDNHNNPFANRQSINQIQTANATLKPKERFSPQPNRSIAPQKAMEQVQLVGLAPQNGSRVTNLTQPVTIAFSEEIMPNTLNEFTFRLEDDFGPVPAKIHYFAGQKQATLTPIGLLDTNKTYRVVVTQGVSDTTGRPIRSGINSMFSTNSPVHTPATPAMPRQFVAPQMKVINTAQQDTAELESFESGYMRQQNKSNLVARRQEPMRVTQAQPRFSSAPPRQQAFQTGTINLADKTVRINPKLEVQSQKSLKAFKVTSIYPGINASNVARRSKIAVHFSEPVDPSSINNINISIFGNQTRVNGRVTYDRRKNRAVFEPERQLDAKTDYKVIVSDKIKSKLGEPLSQRLVWNFATTNNTHQQYMPQKQSAEADAAFYIPLVDSKVKRTRSATANAQRILQTSGNGNGSLTFVPARHWSFKSMRRITSKGILNSFPFTFTDNVTRYEFASAINSALNNLKTMQHTGKNPRLRIADMVELEQLIIEYRNELKTYNVNSAWFENFLQQQGVPIQQIEQKVHKLNRG